MRTPKLTVVVVVYLLFALACSSKPKTANDAANGGDNVQLQQEILLPPTRLQPQPRQFLWLFRREHN